MLDKETIMNTVERYVEAVKKEFSPFAVVLFGSYVNGVPHEDSDIDVGIIFNGFSSDWLEASAKLWCLRHNISFDIKLHLLDTTQDTSGFVKHVLKTGEIIYQSA